MFDLSHLKSPKDFGTLVGLTDRALARLGVWCCIQTAQGVLSPDDAINVLVEFNTARKKASGDPRVSVQPHKVQVSKLTRVMMVGDVFGERGVNMLELFADLHMKKFILLPYGTGITYNGEYNGMVEVAREAIKRNRILNRQNIIDLLTVK